jgi:hypothetical protein
MPEEFCPALDKNPPCKSSRPLVAALEEIIGVTGTLLREVKGELFHSNSVFHHSVKYCKLLKCTIARFH